MTKRMITIEPCDRSVTDSALVSIDSEYLAELRMALYEGQQTINTRMWHGVLKDYERVSEIRFRLAPDKVSIRHEGLVKPPMMVELCLYSGDFKVRVTDWAGCLWASDFFQIRSNGDLDQY